jgi:peptide/nickel transport system ATP-binding protein
MNKGQIEEMGTAEDIWSNPQSTYTRQLLTAIPGRVQPI